MPFPPFSSLGLLQLLQEEASAMERDGVVSQPVAVIACIAMAVFYVAILYAPTVLLRLPPPPSFKTYMIRRFLCAVVSSVLSLFISALILPVCTLSLSLSVSLPPFIIIIIIIIIKGHSGGILDSINEVISSNISSTIVHQKN